MKSIIEIIAFFILLPIIYGTVAIIRYQELTPRYNTYCNGQLNVKSQKDTTLNVNVWFSKDHKFNGNDYISFDFRSRNSIRIYFIPPDTLYVEGPYKLISSKEFKIIKLDNWPFALNPRNDYSESSLLPEYRNYRDSVLLGSKEWVSVNFY